ncbi:MAG: Jag N-terminal domain-containing protein [Elusimicrobiales bacterium]|nr:Jag N-terminal domain-containing protein [Elusimicrobiales bacterium]
MKELKIEAKTVKEAIEKGLKELNLTREQVEVEIVQEEKKGILGINSQNACVIIREKNFNKAEEPKQTKKIEKELILSDYSSFIKSENILEDVKKLVSDIISLSKIDFKITKELYDENSRLVYLDLQSKDAGILLYDGAKGLLSLQQIVSIIINRYYEGKISVKIDSEEFWQKIEIKLKKDIEHAIEFINRTKRPYKMKPMPSSFRKIIHDTIKNYYPNYNTHSVGKGKFRRVIISQNKQKEEENPNTNPNNKLKQSTSKEQNVSNN